MTTGSQLLATRNAHKIYFIFVFCMWFALDGSVNEWNINWHYHFLLQWTSVCHKPLWSFGQPNMVLFLCAAVRKMARNIHWDEGLIYGEPFLTLRGKYPLKGAFPRGRFSVLFLFWIRPHTRTTTELRNWTLKLDLKTTCTPTHWLINPLSWSHLQIHVIIYLLKRFICIVESL